MSKAIDPGALAAAMDHYYSLRGWTPDGIPSREKLLSLGLDEAAGTLHPADRR